VGRCGKSSWKGPGGRTGWTSQKTGRTRLHSHRLETVQVVQVENDPEPWSKATVHIDVTVVDTAEQARLMAQDLTAAAVLLEGIARRSSV
jgi:hypothetical protein